MKSFGRVLTIATIALGIGMTAAPTASACGACGAHVISQPAVIDNSLMQPGVLDSSLLQSNVLPAVIGSGCPSCPSQAYIDNGMSSFNTLTQPAILGSGCSTCPVSVMPAVINATPVGYGYGYGYGCCPRRRHRFLGLF
jgi:hypothetical protein